MALTLPKKSAEASLEAALRTGSRHGVRTLGAARWTGTLDTIERLLGTTVGPVSSRTLDTLSRHVRQVFHAASVPVQLSEQRRSFRLSLTEVSEADYDLVASLRNSQLPKSRSGSLPKVGISAVAAHEFCRWLGGNLPTAREWTQAAKGDLRAALQGKSGAPLDLGLIANLHRTSTAPSLEAVGSRQHGSLGLFDIFGNAAEWTRTLPGGADCNDATCLSAADRVVTKGGYYMTSPGLVSPTYEGKANPSNGAPTVGFRCAF